MCLQSKLCPERLASTMATARPQPTAGARGTRVLKAAVAMATLSRGGGTWRKGAPGAGPAPHCGRNASEGCGSDDLVAELRHTVAAGYSRRTAAPARPCLRHLQCRFPVLLARPLRGLCPRSSDALAAWSHHRVCKEAACGLGSPPPPRRPQNCLFLRGQHSLRLQSSRSSA